TLSDASAVATILASLVAIATLIFFSRDSAARARPYVIAEARIPKFSKFGYVLAIRNAGQTPARDLQVTFDPPLGPYSEAEQGGRSTCFIEERYKGTIDTLGPGQELTNSVVIDPGEGKVSPFPLDVSVTVKYRRWKRWRW